MSLPIGLPEVIHHQYIAAVDLAAPIPWTMDKYKVPELWKRSRGKDIKVGSIDTGMDQKHLQSGDLAGVVVDARDFTGSRFSYLDQHGHGTHTGGTIAGKRGTGVAPECKLYVAKALSDDGSGDDRMLAEAIRWVADCGCQFANLSLGSPFNSELIAEAVAYAAGKGCLLICAAGNDGGAVNFPARLENVISVAAVNETGELADFSCRGPEQDVACGGVKILSCYKMGGYSVLSGTSMAAPFATGMFALAASAGYNFGGSAAKARDWLSTVTVDVGTPGLDPLYGFGLFNPAKVLQEEGQKSDKEVIERKVTLGPLEFTFHYPAVATDMVSLNVKPAV